MERRQLLQNFDLEHSNKYRENKKCDSQDLETYASACHFDLLRVLRPRQSE